MNKIFTLLVLIVMTATARAQTIPPTTQPFGKIDMADMEMKACDFEPDANAEILFDKGSVSYTIQYDLVYERHIRIKIFNEKGKDQADIRIPFFGGDRSEIMSNIQAETINLKDGKIEFIKVDKKLIYTQAVDKIRSALVFSFPNVQPGSVVEFKYTLLCESVGDFPDWYFQDRIPTRYSELNSSIPSELTYKNLVMTTLPMVKNTSSVKAMANIPSLQTEPYMSAAKDNYQRILYQLESINAGAASQSFSNTWQKVCDNEIDFDDFGGQFGRKLANEEAIITKAKSITPQNEKIAYIFDQVKQNIKWNKDDERYTNDGTSKAWDKKLGNSTEINLILYHLLHKAGVNNAYPMLVSTRLNGKVNPAYPSRYQFNRAVVYIPVDSTQYYVLDATNKYNNYEEIPETLLNGYGFKIDKENKKYDLVFIEKTVPVRKVIMVNADITQKGNIEGTAQINSFDINRTDDVENYKENGEKKYIDFLREDDNALKITSLKFDNMDIDTLPLVQNVAFNLDLTSSDDNYIIFKPNLFTSIGKNPFLSEKRMTDIDFRFRNNYSIMGSYKIPAGYKSDALPKNINMTMPDQSIVFKRIVAEQDGSILVRYTINYKKSIYFKEDYGLLHDFYKKMYEMLDEQVILKKS